MKSLDKKEVFIPLILIYIISIILLLTVFKKESVFSKNNRIENVNEAPVVDYAKKSITGKYIGEIGKNENAEKFALFVESFKPDKFKCTLIDYPFYNNPKIEFTILKIQDTLYTSQFGELVFRNDSLKILTETTDNKVVFNFTKREN